MKQEQIRPLEKLKQIGVKRGAIAAGLQTSRAVRMAARRNIPQKKSEL